MALSGVGGKDPGGGGDLMFHCDLEAEYGGPTTGLCTLDGVSWFVGFPSLCWFFRVFRPFYPLQGCVRSYLIAQAKLDPASSLLLQKGRKESRRSTQTRSLFVLFFNLRS